MAVAKDPQKRLGKGLSALLGDYLPEDDATGPELERLPVEVLRPNPFQPRQAIDAEALDGLVQSIQENGLLQPIVVRASEQGGWEIVAGERRWRAVRQLEWTHVPVLKRDVDDHTMLVMALIENLQREDLSPLDEAHAYQRLIDEFGLTQSQVAERVGRDRSTIANTVRLLGLPDRIQKLLSQGKISAGHARALLGLTDEMRAVELAVAAATEGMSVREIERHVRERKSERKKMTRPARTADPRASAYVERAEQALARALGTAVSVRLTGAERGHIEIPFRDAEDFERVVEVIVGVGGVI
jgi:ParB family chromosome partitioning protein